LVSNILYISSLCSDNLLTYIHATSRIKPLYSVQKFHRLLVNGLIANGIEVTSLSAIPLSSIHHAKKIWITKKEVENNIQFIYLPFINLPYVRQCCISFGSFFTTLIWLLKNRKKKPIIIVDVLNVAVSTAAFFAARLSKVKICAIITDIPVMLMQMSNRNNFNFLGKLAVSISTKFLSSYDYYVILTEQMNNLANPKNKPYCIIEGLADDSIKNKANSSSAKAADRIILYAGSLYEKYGIKKLIEAFIRLKKPNIQLHIYGDGEMASEITDYSKKDLRIKFFGVVPNQIVVQKLQEATLLVNPRPSNEEFTKYSFPSKNMEYMVSGTPLITTPLPGMPEEYHQYVYLFNDESIEGFASTIKQILSLSTKELNEFGMRAKEFVLSKKSNIIQARKLIKMLNNQ
jgi:glycosyltransferase involved in cell wall biosynthesis